MEDKKLSPGAQRAIGIVFCLLGTAIAAVGLSGSVAVQPDRFIAAPAGLLFFCAGALLALPERYEVLRQALGTVLITCFGVIFSWIGLGPGERHFSGGMSFGPVGVGGASSPLFGRILFGGFGILSDIAALVLWWKLAKRLLAGAPASGESKSGGTG